LDGKTWCDRGEYVAGNTTVFADEKYATFLNFIFGAEIGLICIAEMPADERN
jgi:hypothetical protein